MTAPGDTVDASLCLTIELRSRSEVEAAYEFGVEQHAPVVCGEDISRL